MMGVKEKEEEEEEEKDVTRIASFSGPLTRQSSLLGGNDISKYGKEKRGKEKEKKEP